MYFKFFLYSGVYEWTDGSLYQYFNWRRTQPSNGGKYHNEDHTVMETTGLWNDANGDHGQLNGLMCKMPVFAANAFLGDSK